VDDVGHGKVPYVDINKAWKRGEDNRLYIDRPKTHRSFREVTIDQTLADMLKELCDGRPRDAWVLTNTQGGPVTYRNFQGRVWAPAITRAMTLRDDNPDPLTFRPKIHALRHSHGSWLVAAGVDLTTVSRRLGHENIQTTINTYGHVTQRANSGAADAYARIMGRT
jgi:integrase